MNSKRKDAMDDDKTVKRVKKECSYGSGCYRRNPAHFREFSHPHLESILDNYKGDGEYPIPDNLTLQRQTILEQIEVIVEKKLYITVRMKKDEIKTIEPVTIVKKEEKLEVVDGEEKGRNTEIKDGETSRSDTSEANKPKNKGNYQKIVPPTRRAEDFLKVVKPRGRMAAKHNAAAPFYIFYTTISDSPETHNQEYSITFLELLDSSLGELECSLQINFMVDPSWLLAQYYFAGYSLKKLTILYEEDAGDQDLKNIHQKKPNVEAFRVNMSTPYGKHHTKMMLFCYEDGSIRVVVSTANLYIDDWENRTQGLWFSPKCKELPPNSMPHDGESPTMFKKTLLRYLNHYYMPKLAYYIDRVKKCDFSHINVFLIASAPGSHFDTDWGLTRVGSLLRQHCSIPFSNNDQWPLIAQASSIGSFGKDPEVWLTKDFAHNFTKVQNMNQMMTKPPELKIVYPSLENVKNSHDGLLGGGCLPYMKSAHEKQPWLNRFLYQWRATSSARDKAMPHIKSYIRTSPDNKSAAFYLLTSGNISKAAWGTVNKGNGALRIMSYECGVLFLPKFVVNSDFFALEGKNRLIVPYDLPPEKYTKNMSPWVSDYLR